ncbi:MAG: Integrase [Patescibacteria group bacterium]|nr:Integrase [Patescibacteria group bacterium]
MQLMQSPNMHLAAQSSWATEAIFERLDVSEATRADYQARIGSFLHFIEGGGLNRNSFLDYKRWLANRTDLAASTKNKHLAVARIWLKELNRQGVLPADITQNVKGFAQGKRHKRDGLTKVEVQELADMLRQLPDTVENARLKAIISLLALQGLRQIEVTRLDVKDLELARGIAHVRGKGRDDTEPVYLHPETVRSLREHLKANRVADGPLFTSRSHNSLNCRLTTRSVRNLVQLCLAELGIEKTTHGLRHYFTTQLIKEYKGDLLEVARYTRHRNIETLQVYWDGVKHTDDLPRYYRTFAGVNF